MPEKFTPNDAIFAFTAPSELTENALSSVCMLHASANSLTSSSSSLRRKRLGEITESAEESGASINDKRSDTKSTILEVDDSHRHGKGEPSPLAKITTMDEITAAEQVQPVTTPDEAVVSPPVLERSLTAQSLAPPVPPKSAPHGDTVSESQRPFYPDPRPSLEPRRSTQSARPNYNFDTASLYSGFGGYKKKVKLHPRPSVDAKGRPKTANTQGGGTFDLRPVSTLPTSVRQVRPQPTTVSGRPNSRRSERSQIASQARFQQQPEEPEPVPAPVNIPLAPLYRPNLVEASAPSTSSRSVTSSSKAPGITPEKQRLMKALQMRKRQQMAEKVRQEEDSMRETELKEEEEQVGNRVSESEGGESVGSTKTQSVPEITRTESREDNRQNGVTSPVSTVETSEGPSTQGSSFTEDIDRSTLDTQDHSFGPDSPKTENVDKKPQVEIQDLPQDSLSKEDEIASTETITSPKITVGDISLADGKPGQRMLSETSSGGDVEDANVVNDAHDTAAPVLAQPEEPEESGLDAMSALDNVATPLSAGLSTDGDTINGQKQRKHKGGLEPIKIVASPASPDASDISDDESFMAELDNATVHEAKPIQVSRSPITPVFARTHQQFPAADQTSTRSGSRSGVDAGERTSMTSGRTITGRWPPLVETGPALAVKKVNVSSGISKRIRALEMFSSRESSTSPTQQQTSPPATTPKSPLSSFRKRASFINKNMAPNMSTTTPPPATLSYPSPAPTPEPYPTISRRMSSPTNPSLSPKKKRESVSVTARIIRSSDGLMNATTGPTDPNGSLNLHRSPLIIEREKPEGVLQPSPIEQPETPRAESPQLTRREKRFSLSSSTSFSKSAILGARASLDRQRPSESALTRSTSETSSIISSDDRKESRTSRLRKRMSAIASGSRRSIAAALSPPPKDQNSTPTIPEAYEQGGDESIAESVPHEVDIGDVNVQFPDTLLWKRRFMRIDDQGYIILTPPTMEANHRNISKRYHLSEFRKPTIPDLERQELPHSILLDLEDGSTLQCACESKYTQQQVLRSKLKCPSRG